MLVTYSESQVGIIDKQLEKELHVLGQQMDKIKDAISERAKRGMFAATSVPISLTGPAPKRSEKLARFKKDPKSSKDIHPVQKLPEPQFSLLPNCQMDTVCVPGIYEEDTPSLPGTSDPASAGSGVVSASSSRFVQEVAQPGKEGRAKQSASQKISATSEKAGISETPDNTKDSSYVPGDDEEEVEEDQPTSTSSSQQESLLKGIPVEHKKGS